MGNPNTLQSIMTKHLPGYMEKHPLDGHRQAVCRHIKNCRTEAMGGLQMECNHCHDRPIFYYACRDRHCPHCQRKSTLEWRDKQLESLLPVTYYHLVFTLPHELNGWVQLHPNLIYRLLFKVAWKTLKAFGADPKRLNGQLGMTAVPRTWGQNLSRHVHLHCLVPGGVIMANGNWNRAKSQHLFPIRALSRHYRGSMVSALRACANKDELHRVDSSDSISHTLNRLMSKEWVVYCKNCLNLAGTVVNYLARYTHRIAISNQRILSAKGQQITFRLKDYADEGRNKSLTLEVDEFIRRYLMHVVPKGLMRVRHYGYLANCCRKKRLKQIRSALASSEKMVSTSDVAEDLDGLKSYPCQKCQKGRLWVVKELKPLQIGYG